jgi:acyl transferase domain-containing protein/acyl carrier protein/NAD(P)-dependent dehydrogenase (short-subunit alcohol dehydrogenase family)
MSRSTRDPAERAVAVVGVGATLPNAPDAPAFWRNVLEGRNCISEVMPDRWNAADYFDPDPKAPGKTYSKIGGWVRNIPFDSTKYRIPPKVAAAMDDGQKWGLVCASEALRDAGHPDRPLNTESTGVILGNAMGGELHYQTCLRLSLPEYVHAIEDTDYFRSLPEAERVRLLAQLRDSVNRRFPDTTEDTMPGELTNITAGRVASVLNLRGPNFTADAACASSLAALQSAIDGLVDHHYDVVLTGGMDRNMGATTFIKFCKIGALSPDGSRPYDKGANGFVMGEGGAFFVCKRLADAEKAGDRIYAVIRGVGGSSDGKGKGITAPNPVGQIIAVRRAWERAGLDLSTATLIEGHGTSTRVGDAAEMESLAQVLSECGSIKNEIAVGSIKSQIGHLKSAAGAAGLLKAVMACHHKILPPSINFQEPNPNIPWARMPIRVNTKAQPWERPASGVRRCGLSAFGFGGTNFHVVVEEHVPGMLTKREPVVQVPASYSSSSSTTSAAPAVDNRPAMLGNMLAVGGRDIAEVKARLQQALEAAKAGTVPGREPPKADFLGADARLVIAFEDAEDLLKKGDSALQALDKNDAKKWRVLQTKGIHFRCGPAGKVAFLFPGQGSQYVNMLADVPDPIVRETFAEADRVMAPILGQPLTSYVYKNEADAAAMAAAEEALKDTTICQPAMVATDISIMRLLGKHGVKPDLVMGHSLGEWSAAVGAGMITFAEALVAVSARARAMASVSIGDKGKMASVLGPADEIVRRLPEIGGYLTPANMNSRKQTVIAGASDAVDRAVDYFNKLGMTAQIIPVSHAFHSKVVAPASDALYRTICEMQIAFPKIPLVGNIDGDLYPTDNMETIKRRLAEQMASSVQFVKGVETCYREGARIFVEVGPKRALQALAESILEDKDDVITLSTNHPKRGGVRSFHDAMCGLYAAGIPQPQALLAAIQSVELKSAPVAEPVSDPVTSHGAQHTMSDSPSRTSSGQPDYEGLGKLFARFLDEGMSMYGGRRPASPPPAAESRSGSIVVSGAALGLPGQKKRVFDDSNVDRILGGESFIEDVPHVFRSRMVEKNVVRLHKREVGEPSLEPIKSVDEVIRLAGRRGAFDLIEEFGIPRERVEAYDVTTALAIAAGIEALRDAGIPLVRHYRRTTTGSYLPDRWRLPTSMADETGVIFASAFPGYDNLVNEITQYYSQPRGRYEFDRRFLFRVLSMGHAQFAELLGLRGPNTQVNSACASTTAAVAMAEDWIRAGRCRRVLVIGADDLTSDNLLEWMGAGFLATGAATTEAEVEKAALPFDRRRNGMLLGMGACGIVVESEDAVRERGMRGIAEVLGTEIANSAFHGTRLDVEHIEGVMERLVSGVESRHGIDRHQMARELVFISHETYTPARGGSAAAEVFALRKTFGPTANDLVVSNTKGFTGHPMGVGVEDAIAVKILEKQTVPPVPNYREPDPELGTLNLSKGGRYPVKYALRLAAGFGSQIAMSLLRRIPGVEQRVVDRTVYERWLSDVSGYATPVLEVEKRTLRIKDAGQPTREPAKSSWTIGKGPRATVAGSVAGVVSAPAPVAAPVAKVAPVVAPAPVAAPVAPAPTPAAAGGDAVMEKVLQLVSGKTGYPRDMLDPDLDLEADLGIDTVKQAEVFGLVRETFDIPRQDTLKLRDYPTLRHVVGFVKQNKPELAGATTLMGTLGGSPVPPATGSAGQSPAAPNAIPAGNSVAEKVLELVAGKTGYPRDMLDLDLDLEADLGIDTVKQAEVFGLVRETFDIPRQDTLKLRDYPTLRHVIGFVTQNRPELAGAVVAPAAAAPVAVAPVAVAPVAPAPVAAAAPAGNAIAEKVLGLVAEKTGYPRDMLELDLDLEADLGVDTVKQAEVFGLVRETFDIPRQDNLKLRDYPTLRHVIGFVETNRPDLVQAAAAAAPVAAPVSVAAPVAAPAAGASPIVEKVLQLVAEKTGYPRDMLELDLDLEADLGVDTVKQAEVFGLVRETFDIPRQDALKLRDYPTLRHVIGFVETNRPDLAGAKPAPVATPAAVAAPAPVAPAPAPAPTGDPITEKVLELVAQKTGYPRDMLELDLDLEADLGVDTVKQAEVFALVRESFAIPRQDDVKLRDYPTLRHVIGFVNQHLPGGTAPVAVAAPVAAPAATAAPSSGPVVSTQSPFVSGVLRKPVVALRPPMAACKETGVRLSAGSRVVVVADGEGAGKLLCEQLESRGVQVLRIDARPERAEAEAALRTWAQAGNVAGVFFLAAFDRAPALNEIDLVTFRKLYSDRILLLHGVARGLYDVMGVAGTFFITATRMGGHHGYGLGGATNSLGGSITGFTKALRREKPETLVKVVDFEDNVPAEVAAKALLDEMERDPGAVEIGYRDGLRVTVGLELMQAQPEPKAPIKLDENAVFAVTGGAGAITVAIVRDLASASRGTFYLLDARPMPPEDLHPLLEKVVRDREGAKRDVYERIKAEKGRATPAQVEEKLFDLERQAGILEALRSVEAAGGRAFYRQVDVLDGAGVKAVVDGIRDQSGHLDVVLHAAGLERSRSLDRKPVEEFDLVLRVKIDGLFNLMAATREMDVKAIVGFSSVAGRFGNAGQADYSSGNDFMCKTLSWWSASRPGSLGIALDWTAWGGIGMATRGSIPEIMKRAGIDMLDPAEGLPVIRHALQAGFSGEAVVGRRLGILVEPFDADGGIDPAGTLQARAKDKALPLPFDKVSFDLHEGLRAEIRLDPKVEPFLYDHAIDGIPVLPGVMGLETFAEAAWLLAPQLRVAALEDVHFLAPMKYYRHEPRSVIVKARAVLSTDGRVRVRMALSSVQTIVGRDPEEKRHFTGTVVLEKGDAEAVTANVDRSGPVGGIGFDDIYRVFFHGPAYRVLEMVNRLSSGEIVGTMRTELPLNTTDANHASLMGPRLVEFCFQTAGVWEIGKTGLMGLPSVVDRVTVFDPAPQKQVMTVLTPRQSDSGLAFDGVVRDDDGKVYVKVEGYRTAQLPGGLPEDQQAPFRGVIG